MEDADRIITALGRCEARLSAVEEKLKAYDTNIERFWSREMPRIESQISENTRKIGMIEVDNAAMRVKVGFWGGLAGVAAILWQGIKSLGH